MDVIPHLSAWRRLWSTLRFRWACWTALVVIATALATLLGLRQGVQWALLREMDLILMEDAREIELMVSAIPAEGMDAIVEMLDRKAVGHEQHDWFVQFVDRQGTLIWASQRAPQDVHYPPHSPRERPTVFTSSNRRQVYLSSQDKPANIDSIRVGASLELLQVDMARIDRLVGAAVGIVLLVAPICGYWLAGRAARTVGEIIHSAARLRPSHLEERLPVRGTGDELDKLAVTVNRLLDRIARYLEQRRDMLANAAHELRSPLAAIRSSVEVALEGSRSREQYEELLVTIIDQCTSLESLVNQLLLLSETEADRVKERGEAVELHDVVAKAVSMFQGVAETRGVELIVERLETGDVKGNKNHLRQLINNLVDNAIKYTPSQGKVAVDLVRDEERALLRLVVRDTGVGIAEADQPRVFERFFRADRSRARDSATPGTGLGLSICEAVVQSHGGQITCESEVGAGTTFVVSLPLIRDAE